MTKERMPLRKLLATVNTMDAEGIQIEVERDGKDIILDQTALDALAVLDTNGRPHGMVNTSGQQYTVEASASTISGTVADVKINSEVLPQLIQGHIGSAIGSALEGCYASHKIFSVAITIAAGGAVNNIALHATQAGYKFHFKVLGLWMDVADATTTWFFHSTAGGVACVGCPATPGFNPVNITATYTIINQLTGAYMSNSAVTGDVTLLDIAGVGAGAANGYIFLEGWFETT